MVSPADRSRKASVHRFLISSPDLRIDAAPSLLQLRTARLQHHSCSKRDCPPAERPWRAQAGTGCHEGGIILSKKPPEWRPVSVASRGQPRAHSPAAMVSGFDSCRGKLRDTPKIFTFALSLPLPDGQERRKYRKYRKRRKHRKLRKDRKSRKA